MKNTEMDLSKFEKNALTRSETRNVFGGGDGDNEPIRATGTVSSENYGDGKGGKDADDMTQTTTPIP